MQLCWCGVTEATGQCCGGLNRPWGGPDLGLRPGCARGLHRDFRTVCVFLQLSELRSPSLHLGGEGETGADTRLWAQWLVVVSARGAGPRPWVDVTRCGRCCFLSGAAPQPWPGTPQASRQLKPQVYFPWPLSGLRRTQTKSRILIPLGSAVLLYYGNTSNGRWLVLLASCHLQACFLYLCSSLG